ncbi:unnamed protein product [Sphenostylis stenocarpa]|uniref:Uncharacterized protein n=1 Tax=Sphenostylis stenocarpa TaxID=92480 RepID=A0AA86T241_9FABA|nr:unnamed protein product [Sphenostylis stenocarpa]
MVVERRLVNNGGSHGNEGTSISLRLTTFRMVALKVHDVGSSHVNGARRQRENDRRGAGFGNGDKWIEIERRGNGDNGDQERMK